jgi:anti-anti-sigma factor
VWDHQKKEPLVSEFKYEIRCLQNRPLAVLSLQGNIDSVATHKLNDALGTLLDSDVSHVVVDMVRVGYVNSEGWRVLLVRAQELKQRKGEMRLADMALDLMSVFQSLGLTEIIAYHDNLEDALQASVAALDAPSRTG